MEQQETIYLDHAASAGQRPREVVEAFSGALRDLGGGPMGASHRRGVAARRLVERCREAIAGLIGARDAARVSFTQSATEALGWALRSCLRPGERVLLGRYAHDAVAQPLGLLAHERGLRLEDISPPPRGGLIDVESLRRQLTTDGPGTTVVVNALCNVTGQAADLGAIARCCRHTGARLVVDAALGAGLVELRVDEGIDALALSGHKNLYGPPGVGALYLREGLALDGGLGSGGTPNLPGIAALEAGLRFVQHHGLAALLGHQGRLRRQLWDRLSGIDAITLHGASANAAACVVSVSVAGWSPRELELELDRRGICAQAGLHNAPRVHATMGTMESGGTLRLSASAFTDDRAIARTCEALGALVEQ